MPRVLIWPLSSSSSSLTRSEGLAIGWKTSSSSPTMVETVLVAGVMSLLDHNHNPKQSSIVDLYQHVQQQLTSYQQSVSNDDDNDHCQCTCMWTSLDTFTNDHTLRVHCPGCVTKACFTSELQIVALVKKQKNANDDNDHDDTDDTAKRLSLPILQYHGPHHIPWWTTKTTTMDQIVLYHPQPYILWKNHDSIVFSRTVWIRLTHASYLMNCLQSSHMTRHDRGPFPTTSHPTMVRQRRQRQRRLEDASLLVHHFMKNNNNNNDNNSVFPLITAMELWYLYSLSQQPLPNVVSPSRTHNNSNIDDNDKDTRQKSCFRHVSSLHNNNNACILQNLRLFQSLSCAVMDACLGLLLGIALTYFMVPVSSSSSSSTATNVQRIMMQWQTTTNGIIQNMVQWLNNVPIGFKLNQSLTEQVTRHVTTLLDNYQHCWTDLVLPVLVNVVPIRSVLFLVGLILGGSGLLAVLYDGIWVGTTLPLFLLARIFQSLYAAEIYLLCAMGRLFRGKKKNVLRQRTDTMESDSMQLLLGTIVFVMALFLFTTIFVYHICFATLVLTISMVLLPLLESYVLLQSFPWGPLWYQWRYKCFVEAVYLRELDTVDSNVVLPNTSLLETVKTPYSRILAIRQPTLTKWLGQALLGLVSGRAPTSSLMTEVVGGGIPKRTNK